MAADAADKHRFEVGKLLNIHRAILGIKHRLHIKLLLQSVLAHQGGNVIMLTVYDGRLAG